MKIISKILAMAMLVCSLCSLAACGEPDEAEGVSVVSTIFASYDFAREVAGDNANIKMLVSPGADVHSYDPTMKDIMAVNKCDVFIYVGGESDQWVEKILASVDNPDMKIVKLIDCTEELYHEEYKEGMEHDHDHDHDDHDHDHDEAGYDEHVWTNPRNAMLICEEIAKALCEVDAENADEYKANLAAYNAELKELDETFKDIVANASRKEIIFGDRFPLIYFVKAYGLDYFAAFPGCSSETEPSGATVAFLINKVKEDDIPVVFYLELSKGNIADTICEATGAQKLQFNACHNISKDDFEAGIGYLDLMMNNIDVLRTALN